MSCSLNSLKGAIQKPYFVPYRYLGPLGSGHAATCVDTSSRRAAPTLSHVVHLDRHSIWSAGFVRLLRWFFLAGSILFRTAQQFFSSITNGMFSASEKKKNLVSKGQLGRLNVLHVKVLRPFLLLHDNLPTGPKYLYVTKLLVSPLNSPVILPI